ncbi:hypothetical protein M3650_26565 [Paenibacillus sp. MER TA 81-3]|nr:hypothetical protein [Paenibacillus sp. MER TA 81-3]MCM3342091.1 hypothetical protein [Paenibacillus sp. MER TA 81-3]
MLREENGDTAHILVDPDAPTGEAAILILEDRKNAIIVTAGRQYEHLG